MSLFQSGEERLKSSEMSNQFEDSKDPGDSHQSHDLSSLANNVKFRQVIQNEGKEIGQNGQQIHDVQGLNKEVQFSGGTREPHDIFDGEVDGCEGVDPDDGLNQEAQAAVRLIGGHRGGGGPGLIGGLGGADASNEDFAAIVDIGVSAKNLREKKKKQMLILIELVSHSVAIKEVLLSPGILRETKFGKSKP